MANLPLTQPPCCSIEPFVVCRECKWKACASHWFDYGEDPIKDEFHIPTKPDDVNQIGDILLDNSDIGICIRCSSQKWDDWS